MRLTLTSVNVGGPYKSVEDLKKKDGPLLKKREFLQPTAFGLKRHAHQLFPGLSRWPTLQALDLPGFTIAGDDSLKEISLFLQICTILLVLFLWEP